jgi:hypothetical protein
MRSQIRFAVLVTIGIALVPVCAIGADQRSPDEQSIAILEARAAQAQPREQCFLYAQLVQQMTELSLRNYAAGQVDEADVLLKRIQGVAVKVHQTLDPSDKRLKNAEILLSNTAFRLKEMLHVSAFDDRALVEETLAKVSNAQDATMMQVFEK